MNYFEEINGNLVFREDGETVMVSPWGADSLRVRSCILGEITEGQGALLPPADAVFGVRIRIREKMRDYTRSLMREAYEKGTPVMRAMFYEFPDDPRCWEIKDAYLFGPDILAAPVCHKGAVSRSVYLPEGAYWVSAADGTRYEGGRTIEAAAPIGMIPVFLRDGRQEYLKGEI